MTAGPSAEYLKSPSPAVAPAFSAHAAYAAPRRGEARGESSEGNPRILARLNDRLRVIHGQCGLQWLLQYRKAPTKWETFAYCATRPGLILRMKLIPS